MCHRRPNKRCAAKSLVIIGAILLVIAVVIGAGGPLFSHFGMYAIFERVLDDNLVVDSTGSSGYTDWKDNNDINNPYMVSFYMWNLTNPEAARNKSLGIKPNYVSVGPFVYQRYRTKENVSFIEDGDLAVYQEATHFVWRDDLSNGTEDTLITNVNPAYLGILGNAGGEGQLRVAVAGGEIRIIIDFLKNQFVDYFVQQYLPQLLPQVLSGLVGQVTASFNGNTTAAQLYVYDAWANAVKPPSISADWSGMLISNGSSSGSGIPVSTVTSLFNANQANSLTNVATFSTWMNASDPNNRQTLKSTFSITDQQLDTIFTWMVASFGPIRTAPFLVATWNLTEISDLGYLQWGTALPLNGSSAAQIFPQQFAGGPPEIAVVIPGAYFSLETSKLFLSGPEGVSDPKKIRDFFNTISSGGTNFTAWGLSGDQPGDAVGYITGVILANYAIPAISQAFSQGGDIITTRTVHQWLWDCRDPLLQILQPTENDCSLQHNNTLEAPNTVKTGKGDIKEIEEVVKWREQTSVTDVWNGTLPVQGVTENGQFHPFLQSDDILIAWDSDLIRPLHLKKRDSYTNQYDIKLWRYTLINATFEQSAFYNMPNDYGFANMTSAHKKAPIYLSYWDFYSASPTNTTDKLNGVTPSTAFKEVSQNYVEPYTGKVMLAYKRIQVNLWVPSGAGQLGGELNQIHPEFLDGVFYPLTKVQQHAEINKHEADEFKTKVYGFMTAREGIFWGTLGLGVLLMLTGFVMIIAGGVMLQRYGFDSEGDYYVINE